MLAVSSAGGSSHFLLPPFASPTDAEPLDIHLWGFLFACCQQIVPEKSLCPALLDCIDVGDFAAEGS